MDATPAPLPPPGEPPRPAPQLAPAESFTVQLTVPVSPPASFPTPPSPPPSLPSVLQTAWPRPAQWALVALLGLATVLLAIQGLRSLRWGSRPTELEQGPGYRIDLNTASHAELMQLPGVGEKLAARIEKYKEEHGPFRKVEELLRVPGVGPTRFECWRPWICVGSEDPDEEDQPPAPVRKQPARARPAVRPREREHRLPRPGVKEARLKGKININRATAEELRQLPRIGPKLAQRIIEERERRPFASVEELRRVSGIGPKTLERLRPYVTIK